MRPHDAPPSSSSTGDLEPVVDHRQTYAEDRAAIQEADRSESALAREEAAREPSVRFWYTHRGLTGAVLALLAAVIVLAFRTWPIAEPQGHGTLGTAWGIGATFAGVLYLIGFFLADHRPSLSRVVLIIGAIAHLLLAVSSAILVDTQQAAPGPLAMLFDLVPIVLALVAAYLIGSRATRREIASPEVDRRIRTGH